MAIAMYISAETHKDGIQYIGDLVNIFKDDHQFSETELEKFNFLTINGSVEDVTAKLEQIKPRIEKAYLWVSDSEYHWDDSQDFTEIIRVVQDGNRWRKVNERFKFPINFDELTPEEKQILETIDINHPSVDSFINKIAKDILALSGNQEEVKELRNTEP